MKEWRCYKCEAKLAEIEPELGIVRIKRKDLYLTIEGGKVYVKCYKCLTTNEKNSNSKENESNGK